MSKCRRPRWYLPACRRAASTVAVLVLGMTSLSSQVLGASPETVFVANEGQWPTEARFVARSSGEQVRAEPDGLLWQRWALDPDGRPKGWMVRLEFEGSGRAAVLGGEGRLSGDCHFLQGNDRSNWRRNVPRFEGVLYEDLLPGLDVHVRYSAWGVNLELELDPEVRLEDIVVRCRGVSELGQSPDGRLRLRTPVGDILERDPARYSGESAVTSSRSDFALYRLDGERFCLRARSGTSSRPLVANVGLEWSTYLGGSMGENYQGRSCIGVGPGSAVTVAGITESPDFPTTPGAYDMGFDGTDAFVTRLAPDGATLLFSTFLKGATPNAMVVDPLGVTILAGSAGLGFPTTAGAFDTTHSGWSDGFIAKLAPGGDSLLSSTYFGGTYPDEIAALAMDVDGSVVVAGSTASSDLPTTPGAFDTTHAGTGLDERDAFLARFDSSLGQLKLSTYLGGVETDSASSVALLEDGRMIVGGATRSTDFPFTAGAFSSDYNEMFVAVLSADGQQLQAATSLGGTHNNEAVTGVAVAPVGEIVVAGYTLSSDFPTTPGAFQTTDPFGLGDNGFVSIFDPTLSKLKHSTYLWGGASVRLNTLLVDPMGAPIVGGVSWGVFFPTTPGAFKETLPFGDINDVFVSRFSPDLSKLWYSTYVGGSGWEDVGPGNPGLALDVDGAVVAEFATTSTDFPTGPDPFQPSFGGATDAIVARLDLLPMGVKKYGSSSPGSQGALAAGVTAMPSVGSVEFALTCGHAPAAGQGWLVVGLGGLPTPVAAAGASLWVDPTNPIWLLPVKSDDIGACIVPVRVPEDPAAAGLTAFAQFLWKDPGAAVGPLSASNALEITVQP